MIVTTTEPKQDHPLLIARATQTKFTTSAWKQNGNPEHFLVRFAFGRRGLHAPDRYENRNCPRRLRHGAAKPSISLIASKLAKGLYARAQDGTPYQHTEPARGAAPASTRSCWNPWLTPTRLGLLLIDPLYCAQEKLDGKRLMLRKEGSVVTGINRKGLIVSVPENIAREAHAPPLRLPARWRGRGGHPPRLRPAGERRHRPPQAARTSTGLASWPGWSRRREARPSRRCTRPMPPERRPRLYARSARAVQGGHRAQEC